MGDWCLSCQKEVLAVVGLNGAAQVAKQCGTCGGPIGDALTRPLGSFDAATERARPVTTPPERQADVVRLVRQSKPASQADHSPSVQEASAPGDILGMVKARLLWLESEIARLAGYEAEAKKLRKMLAAAERTGGSS